MRGKHFGKKRMSKKEMENMKEDMEHMQINKTHLLTPRENLNMISPTQSANETKSRDGSPSITEDPCRTGETERLSNEESQRCEKSRSFGPEYEQSSGR